MFFIKIKSKDNNPIVDVEEIDGYSMIINKNYFTDNIFLMKNFLCI